MSSEPGRTPSGLCPGLSDQINKVALQAQTSLIWLFPIRFTDSLAASGRCRMGDLFWLTDAQMARLKPFFPLSYGVPRVDE